MNDLLGKKAEAQIEKWLKSRTEDGYSFDRVPDQMSGRYGSKNICDFILYKYPHIYYIESKATWEDRFDFSMLTPTQHDGLYAKSQIYGVYGVVTVLFASYKRAFTIDIREIVRLENEGTKSLNIKNIDKWKCEYKEIETIPNNRKDLLDYTGEFSL